MPSPDISGEVAERLVASLAVLEKRPEPPPWFSESAIENVQRMGKVLRHPEVSGIGLSAVAPGGEEYEACLTPEIIEHTGEAFQGADEAFGSVAGILNVVNLRRQRAVSLYDADQRHAVRCTFPEDLLETVRQYLGSKVRATGSVTRNRVGQVASVKVESLVRSEEEGGAQSVAELTGIAPWYTGDRTAMEHEQRRTSRSVESSRAWPCRSQKHTPKAPCPLSNDTTSMSTQLSAGFFWGPPRSGCLWLTGKTPR